MVELMHGKPERYLVVVKKRLLERRSQGSEYDGTVYEDSVW
jgi:hypothetical protein